MGIVGLDSLYASLIKSYTLFSIFFGLPDDFLGFLLSDI